MTDALRAAIEDAIWRVAERSFGALCRRHGDIARAVVARSDAYNARTVVPHADAPARRASPSPRRPSPDDAKLDLLARLVFFTVADLPKAALIAAELISRGRLTTGPLRILDVGAGCGAATLGLAAQLTARCDLDVDAFDRDASALELFAGVAAAWPDVAGTRGALTVRTRVGDLRQGPGATGPYDLVVASTVINELPERRRLRVVRELLNVVAEDGHLIVIEPALRETSRGLHAIRDALLAEGSAFVVAPCTHGAPCPALARPDDWCHEKRVLLPPPRLRSLAQATGLRRRDLNWSYIVLARDAPTAVERPWRVVSAPMRSKGKREVFLCGPDGRRRAVRLDRDRTPGNERFRRLDRGQLVSITDAALTADRLRVTRASRVDAEDAAATFFAPPEDAP